MAAADPVDLVSLYESDETAWLDAMAGLVREGRLDRIDSVNLAEYLESMAGRDRREARHRVTDLLRHRLLWTYLPGRRSRHWRGKILRRRFGLATLLEGSGTLRDHAGEILESAYARAVHQARTRTGLPESFFPANCPYTIEGLLARTWEGDPP